jgi:hypothetical protein
MPTAPRILAGILFAAAMAGAQAPQPTAAAILDEAKAKAASEHKAIWAIYHASW